MTTDPILDGIQHQIDRDQPGYTVAHYAVVVGIERLTADERIEHGILVYAPNGQHPYITDGLLMHAERISYRKAAE